MSCLQHSCALQPASLIDAIVLDCASPLEKLNCQAWWSGTDKNNQISWKAGWIGSLWKQILSRAFPNLFSWMENKLICGLCGSPPTLVWVHECCSYSVSHECVFKRHIPAQVKKQTPTLNRSKCVISTDFEIWACLTFNFCGLLWRSV